MEINGLIVKVPLIDEPPCSNDDRRRFAGSLLRSTSTKLVSFAFGAGGCWPSDIATNEEYAFCCIAGGEPRFVCAFSLASRLLDLWRRREAGLEGGIRPVAVSLGL